MSIVNDLIELNGDKSDIQDALVAKGVAYAGKHGFNKFASDITSITNQYTSSDEGKVVSNGALVAQTSTTYTDNGTYDTTTKNSVTVDVALPASSPSVTLGVGRARTCIRPFSDTWTTKAWNGLNVIEANNIWTDGDNIYYSYNTNQYVLNKATSTWTTKAWNGLSSFYGGSVWTDGDDIYYSSDFDQYVLDKATSTWTTKAWNGLNVIKANNIWTDGDNIYYSYNINQYVLVKSPYITNSVPSARPTKAITAT